MSAGGEERAASKTEVADESPGGDAEGAAAAPAAAPAEKRPADAVPSDAQPPKKRGRPKGTLLLYVCTFGTLK